MGHFKPINLVFGEWNCIIVPNFSNMAATYHNLRNRAPVLQMDRCNIIIHPSFRLLAEKVCKTLFCQFHFEPQLAAQDFVA
jgi:hypothetical protein